MKGTSNLLNSLGIERNFTSKCWRKSRKLWQRNYWAGRKNSNRQKTIWIEWSTKTKPWADSQPVDIKWSKTCKMCCKTRKFLCKKRTKKSTRLSITYDIESELQARRESTRLMSISDRSSTSVFLLFIDIWCGVPPKRTISLARMKKKRLTIGTKNSNSLLTWQRSRKRKFNQKNFSCRNKKRFWKNLSESSKISKLKLKKKALSSKIWLMR